MKIKTIIQKQHQAKGYIGSCSDGLVVYHPPGTNIISELTCHAVQVVYDFDLLNIIFDLPEISYNICSKGMYCMSIVFKDLKTIIFSVLLAHFWVFAPFTIKNVFSVQKISLPIRASGKLKCTWWKALFFKNSLAGVSGLVLMSMPALNHYY